MEYTKEQKEALKHDFEVIVNRDLSESSKTRYLSNFDFYFDNYIVDHVDYNPTNYDIIFSIGFIKKFDEDRKSLARATIRKLIECLYNNKEIDVINYLKYIGRLRYFKKKEKNTEYTFLNNKQLDIIFNNLYKLKEHGVYGEINKEVNFTAPLIRELAYKCYFGQEHIKALKIGDINIHKKVIRNKRYDDDNNIAKKWISIEDNLLRLISNYYLYRNIDYQNDYDNLSEKKLFESSFLVFDTDYINKCFAIFNYPKNIELFDDIRINVGLLVRSAVFNNLYYNRDTMENILHCFGFKRNTQFESAVREYFTLNKIN